MKLAPLIEPGQRFGSLIVLRLDALGRRATCVCACKRVIAVAANVLARGAITSCGCAPPTEEQRDELRAARERWRAARKMRGRE